MSTEMNLAKPFLKWAGGKTQLTGIFEKFYPGQLASGQIKKYCEPFLGGGAVYFNLVQKYSFSAAILADVNPELVLTYRVVQQKAQYLTELLWAFQKRYHLLDEAKRTEMFYAVRQQYNASRATHLINTLTDESVERAAQMIFLNRTCFNGLFRLNASGGFNVPTGRYKSPTICDAGNIAKTSELLSIADIRCSDFRELTDLFDEPTFFYLDPPYRPISKTASFTSYSTASFNDEDQKALASFFRALSDNRHFLMLSNSDPKNHNLADNFFDDLYAGYHISRVLARRMVNSDASKRGAINEIIVTNYLPDNEKESRLNN